MNFIDFKEAVRDYPLFKTSDLRLIVPEEYSRSLLNNLKNWERKGYLLKIRKGLYLLGEMKSQVDPSVLATKLYFPSYVSLEKVLGDYDIIPEAVFSVTCVTCRKTKNFDVDYFGRFSFQKIKGSAFLGFEIRQEKGVSYYYALPEKALVDFFYLNQSRMDGTRENFESYRFNEEFNYNKGRLLKFAKAFQSKKAAFLTNQFIKFYAAKQ
ncbi:MAG: hypothetical protein U5L10_04255 [Candidatus Moranbacteria bacterium]|nr:hypothetical protein [Candidatus Moranbacteria bacterium]